VDIIKKVSVKLLITGTEAKVFLFLAVVLLAGSGYRYFSGLNKTIHPSSYSDSLLVSAGSENNENASFRDAEYKKEVLNFRDRSFGEKKILPKEKSIDINTAGMKELKSLPGIGEKTAQNILEFREQHGRITKADELLDVKGIGEVKLEKIRKYLTIE
jgi:comEA protein